MYYLAFETSCDETSVAVLKDSKVLSNIVFSQIKDHEEFNGVLPELAARLHLNNINITTSIALKEAKITIENIDKFFYTKEPGLPGCLQIGIVFAKTLATISSKEFLGINHLYAHIFSANIENKYEYPFIALLVSGGNTALYYVESVFKITLVAETRDDAVGECFDKVATLLGLKYPGGPEIDRLSKHGKSDSFLIPTPKFKQETLDFSFSGIKSFMVMYLKNNSVITEDACATFQKKLVDILLNRIKLSYDKFKPKMFVVVGGVSCNSLLRKEAKKLQEIIDIPIKFASKEYCTDNAAMVGFYGSLLEKE